MGNHKLERAAYSIVDSIKLKIKENVTTLQQRDARISDAQWKLIVPVVIASIDQAYELTYPSIEKVFNERSEPESTEVIFPDSFIDVAAKMTSLSERKRDFAAFTIVRNEQFFLDLWCSYYSKQFGQENLYVLDNSSDDDSIEKMLKRYPGVNVVSVPNESPMNWTWCTNIVKCFQRLCLRGYKVAVFSDSDEFLIPESGEGLRRYCEKFLISDKKYVRAKGWGVVQQLDSESSLVNTKDVLNDRKLAWRAPGYDKTLISKVPLNWAKGSHTIFINGVKLSNEPIDSDLSLVHLRDIDVNVFHQKCCMQKRLNSKNVAVTFHSSTNVEDVKKYFKTRIPSWNAMAHEYDQESRVISETWRKSFNSK